MSDVCEQKLIELLVALAAPAAADEVRGWAESLVKLSHSRGEIKGLHRLIAASERAAAGEAGRLH